jgi:deazaflavin-dependent oxidoreductase (nitroreductase family)
MADRQDWNSGIIEEFRNNEGRVGGMFEGRPILLLHTVGAKTGQERVNPLAYMPDGDNLIVFASKGGAPTNPDWFYNLKAHSEVTVEVGTRTVAAHARVTEGDERDALWKQQVGLMPQFGEYERNTERIIPVIVLTPDGE